MWEMCAGGLSVKACLETFIIMHKIEIFISGLISKAWVACQAAVPQCVVQSHCTHPSGLSSWVSNVNLMFTHKNIGLSAHSPLLHFHVRCVLGVYGDSAFKISLHFQHIYQHLHHSKKIKSNIFLGLFIFLEKSCSFFVSKGCLWFK